MKVFEFHFNPKAKPGSFFKSFSSEPKNTAEQKRGHFYVAGELAQAIPSKANFLDTLAKIARNEYYIGSTGAKQKFSESLTRAAVKKVNEFLRKESKDGNVDWLGNLHLAICSCVATGANSFWLHCAKAGSVKILLLRGNTVVDIGKGIESREDSNPAHTFGSIATGKALPGDRVLIATRELFDALSREQMVKGLKEFSQQRQFSEFFKKKEKQLERVPGILFLILVEEPTYRTVPVMPIQRKSKATKNGIQTLLGNGAVSEKAEAVLRLISNTFSVSADRKTANGAMLNTWRNRIVLALFAALLGLGIFYFQGERMQEAKKVQEVTDQIKQLRARSAEALKRNDEKNANRMLQQAWQMTLPFAEGPEKRDDFVALRKDLESQLAPLNHVQAIEHPELFYEINRETTNLIPQRLLTDGRTLYAFNPFYPELYAIDLAQKTGKAIQAAQNLKRGILLGGSPVFFSDPNILLQYGKEVPWKQISLPVPSPDFHFDGMGGFGKNVYFFDSASGHIVQYVNALSGDSFPTFWIDPKSLKNAQGVRAMALDGNVWALMKTGEIQRYFKGMFEETVSPVVFPPLENPTQIQTSPLLSSLYLLDPPNDRLVVFSKYGEILKQYQSPEFDNLLDFSVSDDGKTIYILNGFKIFKITE